MSSKATKTIPCLSNCDSFIASFTSQDRAESPSDSAVSFLLKAQEALIEKACEYCLRVVDQCERSKHNLYSWQKESFKSFETEIYIYIYIYKNPNMLR